MSPNPSDAPERSGDRSWIGYSLLFLVAEYNLYSVWIISNVIQSVNLIPPVPPPGEDETSLYITNITLDRCLECLQCIYSTGKLRRRAAYDGTLSTIHIVRRVRLQAPTY